MTKRVLVDLDGIVVDILAHLLPMYGRATGDILTVAECRTWDFQEAKHKDRLEGLLKEPGFFRDPPAIPGAIRAVGRLSDQYETFIVSAASHPENFTDKALWVRRHLPFIHKRRFVLMHEKHLIAADAIIDDKPATAENFRQAQPEAAVLTIAYPYNDRCTAYDLRAPDFTDTVQAWDLIEAFLRGRLGS